MGGVKERRGHVGLPNLGELKLCAPDNAGKGLGREAGSRGVCIYRGATAGNKEEGTVRAAVL